MNAERIKDTFWNNHREIKAYRDMVEVRGSFEDKADLEFAQRVQFNYAKRLLAKMTDEQLAETFGSKWVGFVKRWIGAEWVVTSRGTEYAKLSD
jgi:hypothetical protein